MTTLRNGPWAGPLGGLLLDKGWITAAQLDAGLRAQVLLGGRLGTNLVQLGHLGLDQLTHALSEQLGVPPAWGDDFERLGPAQLGFLTAEQAAEWMAIPLGDDAGGLAIACAAPGDEETLRRLVAVTGRTIVRHVAPELRILYYLERHYRVARKNRYLRVADGSGEAATPGGQERRRYVDASLDAATEAWIAGTDAVTVAPATDLVTLEEALARLALADGRDGIADTLIAYLEGRVACGLVLACRDGMALGWRGFARGAGIAMIDAVAVTLALPSSLSAAHRSRTVCAGPPSPTGGEQDARLWRLLHLQPPTHLVVAPVVLGERVVSLVVAHGGDAGMQARVAHELETLTSAAATAFARLIQRARPAH